MKIIHSKSILSHKLVIFQSSQADSMTHHVYRYTVKPPLNVHGFIVYKNYQQLALRVVDFVCRTDILPENIQTNSNLLMKMADGYGNGISMTSLIIYLLVALQWQVNEHSFFIRILPSNIIYSTVL